MVKSPGGPLDTLTHLPYRVAYGIASRLGDGTAALLVDSAGDENHRVEILNLRTEKVRVLDSRRGRVHGLIWDSHRPRMAYAVSTPGETQWEMRLTDLHGNSQVLWKREETFISLDFSADGKKLLCLRWISASAAELWEVSGLDSQIHHSPNHSQNPNSQNHSPNPSSLVESAPPSAHPFVPPPLVPHRLPIPGPQRIEDAQYDGEGRVILLADGGDESLRLWKWTPGTPTPIPWKIHWPKDFAPREFSAREFASKTAPSEIDQPDTAHANIPALEAPLMEPEWFQRLPDGGIALAVNRESSHHWFRCSPIPSNAESDSKFAQLISNCLQVKDLPPGRMATAIPSPGGWSTGITWTGFDSPGAAYSIDWKTLAVTRWADAERSTQNDLPLPQRVQLPAAPGLPNPHTFIPGWLLRPSLQRFPGPRPLIIDFHGGPEAQAKPGYSAWHAFAREVRGYAILRPDVRGSSGYGRAYQQADDKLLRGAAVADAESTLAWAQRQPWIDPQRIAVTGRSYGGFLSLSLAAASPPPDAVVSGVGIADFPAFLEKTSGYRRELRRVEYGDESDSLQRAFLKRISPQSRVKEFSAPVLLLHGKQDPRVPYSQSTQLQTSLQALGKPVELITLDEDGHGITTPTAEARANAAIDQFLLKAF
jgi:dienelactone hydrolase